MQNNKMRIFRKAILYIVIFVLIIFIFNIPVTTRQGVNYTVFIRKIPFYIKLCGFLYRDYQYKELSQRITNSIEGDNDKVMAIYNWTVKNIKRPPKGFTIIDDHIWSIIVRGYGTSDQMADVFATLASYAGYRAFWEKLYMRNVSKALILSFVKISNTWYTFDVYSRKSFMKKQDILLLTPYGPTYADYLKTMDKAKFNSCIRRPDRQRIIPRLIYELKKVFLRKDQ